MKIQAVSPQDLAAKLRDRLTESWAVLYAATGHRALAPDPPADCPEKLAALLAKHAERVAEWESRRDRLTADVDALALLVAKAATPGTEVSERALALRAERYDLLQAVYDLVVSRKPLLEQVVEVLEPRVAQAETALERSREKAAAGLRRAGWQSEAELTTGKGQHPAAEARQLAIATDQTVPVRAALATLTDAKTALDMVRRLLMSTDADLAVIGQRLIEAWQTLAGDLV
ncbi:MAG: hypothetical protein NTX87_00370 [Planctomycetota bacterium]|nr:hypothetical protein [Planctomycetota bacterium]